MNQTRKDGPPRIASEFKAVPPALPLERFMVSLVPALLALGGTPMGLAGVSILSGLEGT